MHDLVWDIDPVTRKVVTSSGKTLVYDACVVAPGIDFKWDGIEGYDENVAEKLPHAWQAGPQTTLLQNQIQEIY